MINLLIVIILIETFTITCMLVRIFVVDRKVDGKLTINEARDSWTISIKTEPEKLKKRKYLRLYIRLTK